MSEYHEEHLDALSYTGSSYDRGGVKKSELDISLAEDELAKIERLKEDLYDAIDAIARYRDGFMVIPDVDMEAIEHLRAVADEQFDDFFCKHWRQLKDEADGDLQEHIPSFALIAARKKHAQEEQARQARAQVAEQNRKASWDTLPDAMLAAMEPLQALLGR